MARGRGEGHVDPERLRALVAEIVTEKLEGKIAREEGKGTPKAAFKAEVLKQIGEGVVGGALDVWTREAPGARRATLTREDIAAAAIRLADTGPDGMAGVTMRRLAADLGVGTMTLYHYVRTKDELLTLVTDAVMGEVLVPSDELTRDWRASMTVIARSSLAAFRRHPWTLDITDDPPLGPNHIRHFDQTLQALDGLDADLEVKLDVASAVDEYVFGFALLERNNPLGNGVESDDDASDQAVVAHVRGLVATGAYPQLTRLVDERGFDSMWRSMAEHRRDADRFERNLRRLLTAF